MRDTNKSFEGKMNDLRLTVDSETPFSRWLYKYIFATMDISYIVETQAENLRELGPGLISADVNEYATSKADLLIRNEKLVLNDKLKCVYISVDDHHCGAGYDCISTLPCVSGMVAELQIANRTS